MEKEEEVEEKERGAEIRNMKGQNAREHFDEGISDAKKRWIKEAGKEGEGEEGKVQQGGKDAKNAEKTKQNSRNKNC